MSPSIEEAPYAVRRTSHMIVHNYLVDAHACFLLVESEKCSLREVATKLGRSYRQTKRLWRKYRDARGSIIVFAQRHARGGGRNRSSSALTQAILDDKRAHPHRSAQHVAEAVSESLGPVSRSTVRRVLEAAGLLCTDDDRPLRVHARFEAGIFAERFQMDTTSGAWMAGHRLIYLIAILDDHSRMLVGWKWAASDDAWNNMAVLRETFEKHGLPRTLYTDNASMFKTIRHGKSIHQNHRMEGYETEIQRAMRELGVTMFSHKPYEPQGKGKIERFFRFVQERFVREHTATTLEEINRQFAPWAAWYNNRHVNRTTGQRPKDRATPSASVPVPERRRLESAFCFKTTRKIDKSNAFRLFGGIFTIDAATVLVHRTVDIEYTRHEVRVYYGGRFIERFTSGEVPPDTHS